MARSGASLVVDTSLLSTELIDAVHAGGAEILAVHVVASTAIIEQRLEHRLADGGPVADQLASQHRSGLMDPTTFEPPGIVDTTIELDTSDGQPPDVEPVEAAAIELIAGSTARDSNSDESGLDAPTRR